MTNAVTYCRISSDRLEQGAGVERQRVDTDRICKERGWTVVERLVDNDRSASKYAKKGREGWARLLELLAAGAVEAVVAYDLDRLTRRPDDLAPLIDAAERGVKILTATGNVLNLATDDGIFAARILLAVAEKEAANASRRQKAKLRHDAENGRPHWPRRPFGYELDGQVVKAERAWVRKMVRWINEEGISATEVAVRLNAAGVDQPSGKRWQSAGVKLFLKSPRNVGLRTYNGKVIGPASWEPLINEDEWRTALASLEARAQGTRQGRRSMMTGLIKCGRCGERMTRTNSTESAVYRCTRHADLNTGCNQSINAAPVDEHVAALVLDQLADVKAAPREVNRTTQEVDDLERLRADLDDLAAMFGRGELTMSEFKAAREPLVVRLDAAESIAARSDASSALARLAGDTATLRERWVDLDADLRRRLVALVLEHVVIEPTNGKRRPPVERVTPVWKS